MNPPNERTVRALRELAERLEAPDALPIGAAINHMLSEAPGENDADRLLLLLLDSMRVPVVGDTEELIATLRRVIEQHS